MTQQKLVEHLREIKNKWKDKQWLTGRIVHHSLGRYYRWNNKGMFVMREDWDNLILLDACRYDSFVEVSGLEAECRISRGLNTVQFLEENFTGKYNSIVYFTANP